MKKDNDTRKLIVISAVNLFEGGTLTVLKSMLGFAESQLSKQYRIIALVHKIALLKTENFSHITFYEYPSSRKHYFNRLYLEYHYFSRLSNQWQPYLWFSLHDISPSVKADLRMVYCHNSTPFKKVLLKDLFFQPVVFFFSLFYKFLYQINIHKNDYVVVQQVWFKKAFIKLFGLDPEKVLVCYPETENNGKGIPDPNIRISEKRNDVFTFFYPSLPRPFKNFELIAEAILMLQEKGVKNFKVIITISGTENNYSKYIYKKYSSIPQLDFIGRISLEHVHQLYHSTDALLFPSTLETWGLPISEFKAYHKPMLVSGLPYAQESVGSYDKVMFFDPARASDLSEKMAALISDQPVYAITREADEEVLRGWPELFKKVLNT